MDHNSPQKVVTRYAPSPTGFQHVGGLRTALYAYLFARQHQGTFILRIEDTDKNREVQGAIQHTIDALKWLGLEYDYGPDAPGEFVSCLQSDRLHIYKQYAEQLLAKGLAYPDPYSDEELNAFREQAQAENRPFLYRHHRPDTFGTWDGTQPLRFKVPEIKRYTWHDAVRGELTAGEEMLDDFILLKSDGFPTYNFAHIVDDLTMGVTHVMRGEEFISSMPRFLSLYDALEIPYPIFVTLPPIMGPDGKKKLSKRDGAKDIMEYKTEGYLPETMTNFLALIGWNPGTDQEIFTLDELIAQFSIDHIQRSGGAFNEDKLLWMNREHVKKMDNATFIAYVAPVFADSNLPADILTRLAPTLRERTYTLRQLREEYEAGEYDYVQSDITYDIDQLLWKKDPELAVVLPRLQQVHTLLATADFSSPDTIKAALWDYAEATGRGEVLWPLRMALTGMERSPDPFTIAYIIGQSKTLERIKVACDKIERNATT